MPAAFCLGGGLLCCLATSGRLQLEKPLSLPVMRALGQKDGRATGESTSPLPPGPRLLGRVPQMASSQLMPDDVSRDCSVTFPETFPETFPFSFCLEGGGLVCLGEGGGRALEGALFSSGLWAARQPGQVSAPRPAVNLSGRREHREPGPFLRFLCGWPLQAGVF